MGYYMVCNHCRMNNQPSFDDEGKIYCSECNVEINNVSPFIKNQIKSLNTKRAKVIHRKPYIVECVSCKNKDTPQLFNKKIVCSKCGKELENISLHFKIMLQDMLKKIDN